MPSPHPCSPDPSSRCRGLALAGVVCVLVLTACGGDSGDTPGSLTDPRVSGQPASSTARAEALATTRLAVGFMMTDNWNDLAYQFTRLDFQERDVGCATETGGSGVFAYRAVDADGNGVLSQGDTIRIAASGCQIGAGSPVYDGEKVIAIDSFSGRLGEAFELAADVALTNYSIRKDALAVTFDNDSVAFTMRSNGGDAYRATLAGPPNASLDFTSVETGISWAYRLFDFAATIGAADVANPLVAVDAGLFERSSTGITENGSLR